jgi:23S rRNA pseudouridine2605 synthase
MKSSKPISNEKRPLKTLERLFSKAGAGSRTEARSWIGTGRVRVNGKVVQNPDQWVDLERDKVTFDGKPLRAGRPRYVLLYKPTGYITTYKDPENRPTVYDLLTGVEAWVIPAGRLDLETSGLLILTNDTQFAEAVTNPVQKVPKTYRVKASTLLSEGQLNSLRQGVTLSDGPTRPAEVVRLQGSARHTQLEITIAEGRNRQVRRMLEAVESKVLELERTAIGPIQIGDLAIGTWRDLTPDEIARLVPPRSGEQQGKAEPPRRPAPPPRRSRR